jgi:hypothetical protein
MLAISSGLDIHKRLFLFILIAHFDLAGGHRLAALAPPPCCSCRRSTPPLPTVVPSATTRLPLPLSIVVCAAFFM